MTDLDFLTVTELAALIRDRTLSPVELMRHTLDRIGQMNGTLNAVVSLDSERALHDAAVAAGRIARGEEPGPLAGIPLAVKDLEDARGFPTGHGTSAFRGAAEAETDSPQVARLRAAGAIVVGKTNAPPMGAAVHTANDLFGVSRNPWRPDRSPGGSSGGSAAAVAAGLVPFATAGDGGGSTRIPAALCGIVGLKPTRGRIPAAPAGTITNWPQNICLSPMTRTARDAALYLDVTAGHHPADPFSLPRPLHSYQRELDRPLPRLRIGVNPTFGITDPGPAVLAALDRAVDVLTGLGHHLVEDTSRHPQAADFPHTLALRQQVLAHHRLARIGDRFREHRADFEPWFAALLDRGAALTLEDLDRYWRYRAELDTWAATLFDRYDLLLTPTTPTTAWPAEGLDARAAAHTGTLPVAFTAVFNDTGHPAITIPTGLSPDGLPCAVQLAAPHHREDLLLTLADTLEPEFAHPHPPATPDTRSV
ncbi:amidase [Streptomyces sp. L2]|uniref:amidase n=1 Tax=Streptomyces sp. L2 TaxID=2162665 RepID=UPI0010105D71|nr:amidase [Streptomyces sp. L2]